MREHSLGAESDLRPSLTDAQTARICETGRPEKLAKGAVLYRQGEPAGHVFLLNEGRAKASSLNAHGDETLLRVHIPGSLLGLTAIGIDPVRDATAAAITDCQLTLLTRHEILALMHEDAALGVHIAQLLRERLASFQFWVNELRSSTVEQRVARALLCFSTPDGTEDPRRRRDLLLTHKELSQIVAARRPTVSQALQSLADTRLIRLERGRIVILEPEGLSRFLID